MLASPWRERNREIALVRAPRTGRSGEDDLAHVVLSSLVCREAIPLAHERTEQEGAARARARDRRRQRRGVLDLGHGRCRVTVASRNRKDRKSELGSHDGRYTSGWTGCFPFHACSTSSCRLCPMVDTANGDVMRWARSRVGSTIKGKYRIDDVIGAGGMAVVFRATHRNQAEFAIKMLLPELSFRKDLVTRFLREGYAAN